MTVELKIRSGAKYVCAVDERFGAVTNLEVVRCKVLVSTESGISMIVPNTIDTSPSEHTAPDGDCA